MVDVQVKLSSKLKEYARGNSNFVLKAQYLRDLILALGEEYPDLKEAMFFRSGKLKPFCRIFRNSRDVSDLAWNEIQLYPGDEIQVVQALSGG